VNQLCSHTRCTGMVSPYAHLTFVSKDTLIAVIPATDLRTAGNGTVTVLTLLLGGGGVKPANYTHN